MKRGKVLVWSAVAFLLLFVAYDPGGAAAAVRALARSVGFALRQFGAFFAKLLGVG